MTKISMKILGTPVLSVALFACAPEKQSSSIETTAEILGVNRSGSFDIRNREIREEMIQLIDAAGIEYWIGDEGAIHYDFADGEAIDKIGNEVISEYITRN